MFEKDLELRLKRIFGVKRTTFNAPDFEAPEQDCLFVQILSAQPRMQAKGGGRETYRVTGYLTIFSQATRVPFGFFFKKLEQADPEDSHGLFFEKEMDIPDSPARIQNIQERRVNFTFWFDSEYDPNRGSLTSMTTSLDITE